MAQHEFVVICQSGYIILEVISGRGTVRLEMGPQQAVCAPRVERNVA